MQSDRCRPSVVKFRSNDLPTDRTEMPRKSCSLICSASLCVQITHRRRFLITASLILANNNRARPLGGFAPASTMARACRKSPSAQSAWQFKRMKTSRPCASPTGECIPFSTHAAIARARLRCSPWITTNSPRCRQSRATTPPQCGALLCLEGFLIGYGLGFGVLA